MCVIPTDHVIFAIFSLKGFVRLHIVSQLNGFVLSIDDSSQTDKASVTLSPAKSPPTDSQLWHIDMQFNGSFLIVSEVNGKVLDCGDGANGTMLTTRSLRDPENRHMQCWRVEGSNIVSTLSNFVITIKDGNIWPGASLFLLTRDTSVSVYHQFEFTEVCGYYTELI